MDESKLSSISFDFMKKGKKEITLDEIRQQFQLVSYRDTVQVVTYCLDHNLIVPCGKKKTIEID